MLLFVFCALLLVWRFYGHALCVWLAALLLHTLPTTARARVINSPNKQTKKQKCRLPGSDGTWMVVAGGMGAVTQRLARAALEAGAKITTSAPVGEIEVANGAATGVVLKSGRRVPARAVVVNAGTVVCVLLFYRVVEAAPPPQPTPPNSPSPQTNAKK